MGSSKVVNMTAAANSGTPLDTTKHHRDATLARAHVSNATNACTPNLPAAVSVVDVPAAQLKSFRCMVEILDEPLTGDRQHDFAIRRSKIEAGRALLSLRPAFQDRRVIFPMPSLIHPDDAVGAQAEVIRAVANGILTPAEGGEISKMITAWVQSLKATRLNPLKPTPGKGHP